ncbi:hypothetical protein W97_08722 [Coniosporium apollinis CBS 100218]|uniref:Ig-like domain-containing protein n=1 Tax=Coniosporium apollinis (strain CBS 100218) TaxID=1168221 RepID=R7Z5M0_CONA1|nr:uncharacterized protein W97_08722 [Coniosporium apollinis CBS 100218]EON69462.1 hypothetical protein W97_08722 [Coniosporium apollinis CBS 100218]
MRAPITLLFAALLGSAAATQSYTPLWPTVGAPHPTGGSSTGSTSLAPKPTQSTSHPQPKPTGTGDDKPPAGSTETLTTYTTVTTCPITYTQTRSSSIHITTSLTTKTLTITSCKANCHGRPTDSPKPPFPSNSTQSSKQTWATGTEAQTITSVYPTTITKAYTTFVPCSTEVGTSTSGGKTITYYSSWVTPSRSTTIYTSLCTTTYTLSPHPPAATIGASNPILTVPAPTICPPPTTVYTTIYVTPSAPPRDCQSCYEIITATISGTKTTTLTITRHPETEKPEEHKPTGTDGSSKPRTSGTGKGTWSWTTLKPTGVGYYHW